MRVSVVWHKWHDTTKEVHVSVGAKDVACTNNRHEIKKNVIGYVVLLEFSAISKGIRNIIKTKEERMLTVPSCLQMCPLNP